MKPDTRIERQIVCGLDQIDVVITDSGLAPEMAAAIKDAAIDVRIVKQ